ncbi:MAG TPA: hypothetical protein VHB79_28000 [Polyangiaceae bacterium]|nr:hypothetical protein [Polyangiaceae bacterium]
MKRIATLLLGFGLWGCDDPLKSVELIEEPRVLGARVEVTGAPETAAPAPGESATVSFLLASPQLSQSLGFALAACPAAGRNGSRSSCAGDVFATISSANGDAPEASLSFDVPADLDASGRLAILGIVCPDGSPSDDGTSCDGAAAGTPVQLELELAHDDDVNRNPELEADSIRFDDDTWPEMAAVDGDCAGLGFVEVAAGSKHSLGIALDEADRDPLPRTSKLDPTRESLQLSHFATAGDLTRAFETIAWDSSELDRRVEWTAPAEAGLVRFWLVLRDFRGGSAMASRAVCVQ